MKTPVDLTTVRDLPLDERIDLLLAPEGIPFTVTYYDPDDGAMHTENSTRYLDEHDLDLPDGVRKTFEMIEAFETVIDLLDPFFFDG